MVVALTARRALGNTEVAVSPLGLGTAQLGNLYGAIDDDTASAIVATANRLGISYFDTAPHYGLGLAEERLGDALDGVHDVVVSTKVGRLLEVNPTPEPGDDLAGGGFAVPARLQRRWDFSRDGVRRSLDDSRRRLRRQRIDIVFVHDPDAHMAAALDEALPALAELRDDGIVGAIGAGMNSAPLLTRLVETGLLDVVLLAGRYTLLEQTALDDLLPAAQASGTSVVVGGVFNSGLLARPAIDDLARYDYAPAPSELLERARRLADVCCQHGTTLPQAAIQFPLAHPAVVSVLVGAESPDQLVEDVRYSSAAISSQLWGALVDEGLLRPEAPMPTSRPA